MNANSSTRNFLTLLRNLISDHRQAGCTSLLLRGAFLSGKSSSLIVRDGEHAAFVRRNQVPEIAIQLRERGDLPDHELVLIPLSHIREPGMTNGLSKQIPLAIDLHALQEILGEAILEIGKLSNENSEMRHKLNNIHSLSDPKH